MPLRLAEMPPHDARTEAMSDQPDDAPPPPAASESPALPLQTVQPAHPLHWGAEALWQQLEPLLPGLSVEIVRTIASTNSALLARSRAVVEVDGNEGHAVVRRSVESSAFGRRAADVQPCLLVAEQQTGGRGRQGRAWHSVAGGSLTFSLGLPMRLTDWSGLSLAVGMAVCEALLPAPGSAHIGLKWPNDVWLMDSPDAGRKLGGVLIETVAAGNSRLVVIGIGLNVSALALSGLQTGLACVQEFEPEATPQGLLARIALPLVKALKLFEAEGFPAFADRFAPLDVLRGQALRTTHPDAAEGVGRGVSATGELIVQTSAGLKRIGSGEVSVRPVGSGDSSSAGLPPERSDPPC